MKKKTIRMTRIYLNNWYQFEDEIFDVGDCTLFTGGNQTGKSTALDAIKYCFNGDTNFNVASEVGTRTLIGYTRCLLSNTTKEYKRNMQAVTTQIAIEFFDPEKNCYFINGACIRTTDKTDTQRYQITNKKLDDLVFKEKNESGQYEFLTRKDFGNINNIEFEKADEGNGYGLNMIGLDIHDDYTHTNPKIQTLRRVINSIIAYQPKAKIDDFIRTNVLPENNVDLQKVSKITDKIESIQRETDEIIAHQTSLLEVACAGEGAQSDKERYDVNIGIIKYLDMLSAKKESEIMNQMSKDAVTRLEKEETNQDLLKKTLDALKEESLQIRQSINDNGGSLLTSYQADFLHKSNNLKVFENDLRNSEIACKKIISIISALKLHGCIIIPNENILINLLDENIDSIEKLNSVAEFKKLVLDVHDKAEKAYARKTIELEELNAVKKQINYDLITLGRHEADSFVEPDALILRNAINKEFDKLNITSRAKLLFENVIGLIDETWRTVLESYMGGVRFHVLVPAKYYETAFRVFKSINGRGTLVKTNLLEKKDVKDIQGSIVELFSIEEDLTKKYLHYLYGRVLQCDDESIKYAENGLTKSGILSSRLSDKKIGLVLKGFCLGKEAFRLNIEQKTKELKEIDSKIANISVEINEIKDYSSICNTSSLDSISYEVRKDIALLQSELTTLKKKIDDLDANMKKNNLFVELLNRQKENDEQIKKTDKMISLSSDEIKEYKDKKTIAEHNAANAAASVDSILKEYNSFIVEHQNLEEKIIKSKKAIDFQTLDRYRRKSEESIKIFNEKIFSHKGRYNEFYGDTYSDEVITKYKDKANELEIKDIVTKRQNLEEQRKAMNHTFKTEFVTAIANNISSGERILTDLSMKLKTLEFSSEYSFKYREIQDDKMSAILNLGNYQKESVNILFSTEEKRQEMDSLELELEEYLKEIIEKNDTAEMERLSDYRQYMTYDLEIKNQKYGDKKVSLKKEIQTESGAGTQIPYLIILAASLMTVYDKGLPSCARIMLIDEPFEKMGEENVNVMMNFMKSNFQIIMCAPDTQLRLLSSHCDQLNTVYIEGKGHTRIYGERKL